MTGRENHGVGYFVLLHELQSHPEHASAFPCLSFAHLRCGQSLHGRIWKYAEEKCYAYWQPKRY